MICYKIKLYYYVPCWFGSTPGWVVALSYSPLVAGDCVDGVVMAAPVVMLVMCSLVSSELYLSSNSACNSSTVRD